MRHDNMLFKLYNQIAPQVGIVNARKTGNMALDMAIAVSIPLFIQASASAWGKARPVVWELLRSVLVGKRRSSHFYRVIEFEKMMSQWGNEEDTAEELRRNNILQRAIILYIGQMGLRYKSARILLSAVKETGMHDGTVDATGRLRTRYGGTAQQLKAYNVGLAPPRNEWVNIEKGLQFKMTIDVQVEGEASEVGNVKANNSKKTVRYMFLSARENGDKVIQAFIDKAFTWYREAMENTEDHSRYLFTLLSEDQSDSLSAANSSSSNPYGMHPRLRGKGMGRKRTNAHRYKRYKLGDTKDFDSIFFPEKPALLKILNHFEGKTGKYQIRGYPHKLGLLLHGPPGTGKTSLIKALALHTKRHIVNVPLARIETSQDLMDIMFDQNFPVVGEDLPISLPFENVIFVMEDVDAASPIVRSRNRTSHKRRKKQKAAAKALKAKRDRAAAKSNQDNSDKHGRDDTTEPLDRNLAKLSHHEAVTATATVTTIAATADTQSTEAACVAPASTEHDRQNGQRGDVAPLMDSVNARAMAKASIGVNGHGQAGGARCPARINVDAGGLGTGEDSRKVKLCTSRISVPYRQTEEDGTNESTDSLEGVVHVDGQKDEGDGDAQRLRVCENGREHLGHDGGVGIQDNGGKDVTGIDKTAVVIGNNADALPRVSPGATEAVGKASNLVLDNGDVVVVQDSSRDWGGQTAVQNTMMTSSSGSSTARAANGAPSIPASASAPVKAISTTPKEEQKKEEESDSDSSSSESSDSEDSDSSVGGKGRDYQNGQGRDKNESASMVTALADTLVAGSKMADRRERKKYASKTGKLDLAGLLNALDGVVDTPGRIVIMTTNHPESLDPALIRPGRIDKKIHLGYMGYPAALEMTRHFFPEEQLELDHAGRLEIVFNNRHQLTPAVVEQLAGECDTINDFVDALEALPFSPPCA